MERGSSCCRRAAQDLVAEAATQPRCSQGVNTTFRAGVPQIYLEVDRVKAKRQGIPLSVIFNTLQAELGSAYVNDFNLFGRTWKVYVQADEPYRDRGASDITQLEVRTATGKMVPLSTLVDAQGHRRARPS